MQIIRSRRDVFLSGAAALASIGIPLTGSTQETVPGQLPAPDRLLKWTLAEQPSAFMNFDKLYAVRRIAKGSTISPLSRTSAKPVHFEFEGSSYDTDRFIQEGNIAGLLILKDGAIAEERYLRGLKSDSRWASFSVEKSFVSALIGVAIGDRAIRSVEDGIGTYARSLRGTEFENVSIRNVLHMSSGMQWNENYLEPAADANAVITIWAQRRAGELIRYLAGKHRVWEPGSKFEYNTADTQLLVEVLAGATGMRPSDYLSHRIWQPLGMQSAAYWQLDGDGGMEAGSICATLRDFARFGELMRRNGKASGRQILPSSWVEESIVPAPVNSGYGYQWWLMEDGSFFASGIYGQAIYVSRAAGVVLVLLGTRYPVSGNQRDVDLSHSFMKAVAATYAA